MSTNPGRLFIKEGFEKEATSTSNNGNDSQKNGNQPTTNATLLFVQCHILSYCQCLIQNRLATSICCVCDQFMEKLPYVHAAKDG